MPKKKNDYDTYEKNHRTDECFSDREKMIESLSKVMAAQVSKTRKLPFDIKNVRLMAAQIRDICILDTMTDDEIREALRDADAAKRLMHNTRDRLYKVPGESVKNLCESMKKLYGNMVNDDGHSREFQKLSENIKKLGETDEKTKDMTPNKREKEIMKAVVNVVQSAVKYMDGKEKVRNTTEDEACFNNALDVLSELTKHIPGIKSRTDAIIDKINSYRSKDKINKEDFTEKYGAQYIRLAEKANRNVQLTDSEKKPVEEDQNINNEINEINEIKIAEPENIVMPTRGKADKRKEQYESLNSQGAAALANEIQRMKDAKEVLDLEKTNNLIRLYINMGNEMQAEYIKIKDDKNKTMLYDKLAKVFAKDYTALLRYKKHLENLPKPDVKKSTKKMASKGKTKSEYMDIDAFYESTRTRTITLSEAEVDHLETVGNSISTRYKVPFIVEDEPIAGKKKGDSCIGYFTKSESYDSDDMDYIMEEKAKAARERIAKKYPLAAEYINELDYKALLKVRRKRDAGIFSELANMPYTIGTKTSLEEMRSELNNYIRNSDASKDEKEKCHDQLESIDNDQMFFAYAEFMGTMMRAENVLDNRMVQGTRLGADTSSKNALTSVFAEILGCTEYVAYSEKMKIKTKKNGKDVVMKGVIMMPAKGLDPNIEGFNSPLTKMNQLSFEESKGLAKSIASIQFLDCIIRNVDRHTGNMFFTMKKKNKLREIHAIDNEETFIVNDDDDMMPFEQLKVVPKVMADAVLDTDTQMFRILMQGYGLSQAEMDVVADQIDMIKKGLKKSKENYENYKPLYIEYYRGAPRIVTDEMMDQYFVRGQLYGVGNLFSRMMDEAFEGTQATNGYNNDVKKCELLAKSVMETYVSEIKTNTVDIINNEIENLKFGGEESDELKKKYNDMRKSSRKLYDFDNKIPSLRFLIPDTSKRFTTYNYDKNYSSLKAVIAEASKNTEEFINAITDGIYENGGKYEEYQSLKAEKDYYNKEYSKEGDISEENKQKLKDMDEEIKSLEETPEIKAILAAIKNREALRKMMDQLNKLEPVVKELPKSRNQYVKIIDRVDDDPDSENVYEGSSVQKAAQERTDYFRNWDNRLVVQEKEPPRMSLV